MPNTVPAAAEGLPEISRRKALAVTGSGLIAALTGLAASTMPTLALPASIDDEAELATIRRLPGIFVCSGWVLGVRSHSTSAQIVQKTCSRRKDRLDFTRKRSIGW